MDKVRLGIIGMGNIGRHHADYLLKGEVARCELVAVASANPETAERYRTLKVFADAEQLIHSGQVDAVVIGTPHFQHSSLGIAALKASVHVMVEKPIAAHKADAQRLIAVAKQNPQVLFAGMFQLRVEPRYLAIQKLIKEELGAIVRVNWINTD